MFIPVQKYLLSFDKILSHLNVIISIKLASIKYDYYLLECDAVQSDIHYTASQSRDRNPNSYRWENLILHLQYCFHNNVILTLYWKCLFLEYMCYGKTK
jgi:hypothetical protein